MPEFSDTLQMMAEALEHWRRQTHDPLLEREKLDRLTAEMDSINKLYPDHTYRKIEGFRWGYLDYLRSDE